MSDKRQPPNRQAQWQARTRAAEKSRHQPGSDCWGLADQAARRGHPQRLAFEPTRAERGGWSRSGKARSARNPGPRRRLARAKRLAAFPGPCPPRPAPSRGCGSSGPGVRAGTDQRAHGTPPRRPPERGSELSRSRPDPRIVSPRSRHTCNDPIRARSEPVVPFPSRAVSQQANTQSCGEDKKKEKEKWERSWSANWSL
jgi:hypothetical protein